MTLLSLFALGLGVVMALGMQDPQVAMSPGAAQAQLATLLVLLSSLAFAVLFGVATFVPYKPWGWTIGVVALGLGLTSCMVIFALPLLIYWLKPETKAAFGRL